MEDEFDELDKFDCKFNELRMSLMSWISCTVSSMSWLKWTVSWINWLS